MYNEFFGLNKAPFNLTPDPALIYMPPRHREALAGLAYAILNRKGFAVLIGDAGTGKTTLMGRALQYLQMSRLHSSVILNPTLTASEFLEMILLNFGITDIPATKPQRLLRLHEMLLRDRSENRVAALVIDEAHKLSPELLEEVRLLSNFELSDQKLLQILLIGQEQLGDILNEDHLRQLKQRIAVRLYIAPLANSDVEQYIRYRWTKCGGSSTLPFSAGAIEAVATWSQGIPRLINSICDNALVTAFAAERKAIGADDILTIAKDLDLSRTRPHPGPAQSGATPAPAPAAKAPAAAPKAAAPKVDMRSIRSFKSESAFAVKPSLVTRIGRKLGIGKLDREYE